MSNEREYAERIAELDKKLALADLPVVGLLFETQDWCRQSEKERLRLYGDLTRALPGNTTTLGEALEYVEEVKAAKEKPLVEKVRDVLQGFGMIK